jgi:hypothetical protein
MLSAAAERAARLLFRPWARDLEVTVSALFVCRIDGGLFMR